MKKTMKNVLKGIGIFGAIVGATMLGNYATSGKNKDADLSKNPQVNCSFYSPYSVVIDVGDDRKMKDFKIVPRKYKISEMDGWDELVPNIKSRSRLSVKEIGGMERIVAEMKDSAGLRWEVIYPQKNGKSVSFLNFAEENHPCYVKANRLY
ncbi:MAG: hypothetical protein AABX93_03580 [Nanoarchaeota archaeon]